MKDRAREDRLAEALRDNLARRKAQARSAGEVAADPPDTTGLAPKSADHQETDSA